MEKNHRRTAQKKEAGMMGQRQREQVQRGCAVGTSGWLADLMLGAGMVLSAAGYWMERKRKAMFYKSQH